MKREKDVHVYTYTDVCLPDELDRRQVRHIRERRSGEPPPPLQWSSAPASAVIPAARAIKRAL